MPVENIHFLCILKRIINNASSSIQIGRFGYNLVRIRFLENACIVNAYASYSKIFSLSLNSSHSESNNTKFEKCIRVDDRTSTFLKNGWTDFKNLKEAIRCNSMSTRVSFLIQSDEPFLQYKVNLFLMFKILNKNHSAKTN